MRENAGDTEATPTVIGSDGLRTDGGSEGTSGTDDDPLGDLARRLRERREDARGGAGESDGGDAASGGKSSESGGGGPRRGDEDAVAGLDDVGGELDGSDDGNELFEEMDVSDLDTDAVWDAVLTDEEEEERDVAAVSGIEVAAATATVEETVGDDHIVPKSDYCESCHFFTSPPEVACTYEGAEIVEIVDTEQFRVRHCPVVEGVVTTDGAAVESDEDGAADETPSD